MTPMSGITAPSGITTPLPTEGTSRNQIEQLGVEFEGVFMSMMLKEMRNSLDEGFFGGESSDSYGGMFDLFIGKHLAQSKPIGISDLLLQQYDMASGEKTPDASPTINQRS